MGALFKHNTMNTLEKSPNYYLKLYGTAVLLMITAITLLLAVSMDWLSSHFQYYAYGILAFAVIDFIYMRNKLNDPTGSDEYSDNSGIHQFKNALRSINLPAIIMVLVVGMIDSYEWLLIVSLSLLCIGFIYILKNYFQKSFRESIKSYSWFELYNIPFWQLVMITFCLMLIYL